MSKLRPGFLLFVLVSSLHLFEINLDLFDRSVESIWRWSPVIFDDRSPFV